MTYVFLCDGNVEDCPKTNCFKHGGVCYHTMDVRHAVNFQEQLGFDEIFYEEKIPLIKKLMYGCRWHTIKGWMAGFRLKIRLLLLNRF